MFQAHVEGREFDWATAVFATSAIHQGSTSRILGPFHLSIPLKQVLSWLKLPVTRGRAAHMKASDNGFESLRDSASPPNTHTPIGSILMATSTAHQ